MRAKWLIPAAITAAMLSHPAGGGPWPRGTGGVYAAVSGRAGISRSDPLGQPTGYGSLYLEYGISERLTAGLDVGRGVSGGQKAVAFLRFHPASAPLPGLIALELGAGRLEDRTVLRPGLSWGKGFRAGARDGWIALDLLAEMDGHQAGADLKLDATLGLNLAAGRKAFAQLQTGRERGDPPFGRIALSLVRPAFGGRMSLETGIEVGLFGDDHVSAKLGLWIAR